jgi:hypothetical protein
VYVPFAVDFPADLQIACSFFDAIYAAVKALGPKDISAVDRAAWDKAAEYLAARR